jgi:glycosyltransferase involved in cell wall biosynthesis
MSGEVGSLARGLRVALLTNFIPPYRLPVYEALRDRVGELRVLVSVPREKNRDWPVEWGRLDVRVQRTLSFSGKWSENGLFVEDVCIHFPYDTFFQLYAFRPDVVISGELGLRTLQAVLFRWYARRDCRLVVWTTLSEVTERNRGAARRLLRSWILPQADAVIVNGASGERYIAGFGFDKRRIFHVPYVSVLPRCEVSGRVVEGRDLYRLLYVGQLVPRKGILPFLTALSRWARENPHRRLEFWVAGDGPLRDAIQNSSLPANLSIRMLGAVPYHELAGVYERCGILVFPTLADEWGVVVNEAMSCGLPVLGSWYSQAVQELCLDGVNGWVFRPDSLAEMYEAIGRALTSPEDVLRRMGLAAASRVAGLTAEFAAERIVRVIEFVVRGDVHARMVGDLGSSD